ncbi:hypothetical protein CS023_20750 [Shewanella xiamenensis]|nr:hypothetical protein CS023_20750 [Shewanella xiamenensis]
MDYSFLVSRQCVYIQYNAALCSILQHEIQRILVLTKNCRVSVNLTLEEQTKLEKLANELDVSQSWVIRRAVQTYLETEINKSIPTNITRVKQACL